ncbi:esterase [Acidobacteria bacterium Mor1]|nr:esterase [Acidobacteria bacterium Mor1]
MKPGGPLGELLDLETIDGAAIDAFLTDRWFPLVEESQATFVYRGEADEVNLRHWIYGLQSSQPFTRVEGTDLWYLVMELPDCSRVEYKIELIRGDGIQWIRDPLNDQLAHDPFGANSVAHGKGYAFPSWAEHDSEARPGTLQDVVFNSKRLGGPQHVKVYLPARFRSRRRYPLIVVHDGPDYVRFAALKIVLDNLIHRQEIPPVIAALTHSHDRLKYYGAHADHARYVVDELVPRLEKAYPLVDRPSARALMGASFGAVASLHTAWSNPGYFGKVLVQSGSFAFSDIGKHRRGPAFDPVVEWMNAFRADPGRPTDQIFVSCGTYESLIYENRSVIPLLQSTGMQVRYVEARDGHNWENWRDRLREGLSWLFPGPLWMVYE